jgi:hypothetical protein
MEPDKDLIRRRDRSLALGHDKVLQAEISILEVFMAVLNKASRRQLTKP